MSIKLTWVSPSIIAPRISYSHIRIEEYFFLIIMVLILKYYFESHHDVIGNVHGFKLVLHCL